MKLTFLGTGTSQGIPIIGCRCVTCCSTDLRDKRTRTSAYLEWDGLHLLIDCGPDFRLQMLSNGLSMLDAVLLTHEHNDHLIGLDDVRPINFQKGQDMPVFGMDRVLQELKVRFAYAFDEHPYPGVPKLTPTTIESTEPFYIMDKKIIPIPVFHGDLEVVGFRFGDLVYLTDVKTIPEQSITKMKHCEVLVINSLRYKEHNTHLNLEEALEYIRIIQPERAFLTHLSHKFPPHNLFSGTLPGGVYPAFDGLKINC